MKKIFAICAFVLFIVAGISFWSSQKSDVKEIVASTPTSIETPITTSNVSGLKFVRTTKVTPDEDYSFGAFCRVNYRPEQDDFFVSFGGSSPLVQPSDVKVDLPGGAEGGNGYYYKVFSKAFAYTGEHGILSESGGDTAAVFADGYYFFLTGGPTGLRLRKIDPATFKEVDAVNIEIDNAHEATNDQMLAYANGQLVVSALYNAEASTSITDQKNTKPDQGYATHNRIYTTDLELVDYFILDDTPHINGSYLVFVDGIYNYITSTAFFGDVIVMQYDENWKYLGVKTLASHGQWSQGAVYDAGAERFYVSYVDLGEFRADKPSTDSRPNIKLAVFDKNWELIEDLAVTEYGKTSSLHAGRPSVIQHDGKLYVSYDIENIDMGTHEEAKDWQCEVSEFEIMGEAV